MNYYASWLANPPRVQRINYGNMTKGARRRQQKIDLQQKIMRER
jgi:hypothetical protein